ncbi:hypothetical protein, partial [Paracraurococcus ruber]|nr:hypothetical protein [Paracraurococcus ruber]
MTLTLRTLGPAWIAAAGTALLAALLLGIALVLPALPGMGAPPSGMAREVFDSLPAETGGTKLREELRALAPQLPPNARSRMEQILAAEERRSADAPPAFVLGSLVARLEAAASGLPAAAPPMPAREGLVLAAGGAGLLAALLALLAGPLALAPLSALRAGLGGRWGTEREDLWGALARDMAARPTAPPAASPAPAAMPIDLPTEDLLEAGRALKEAAAEGTRMARAAAAAQVRLDRAVSMTDQATEALAKLPRLAAAQTEAIALLAARLEAAPEGEERPPMEAALAERLEAAAQRLAAEFEAVPVAAGTLRAAAERLAEEAGSRSA